MADILKSILYGIIEGITEWLPISSTGHMILLDEFVKMDVSEEFFNMFLVVIQLGAILAVIILFWNKIWPFALPSRNNDPVKSKGILSFFIKKRWITWIKILVSCIPAIIVGLLFDDKIDELFYNPVCVSIALIVFGVLFIVVETRKKTQKSEVLSCDDITFRQAIIIGLWQVLAAVFPGTSRSGSTIIGSLLCGVSRAAAAEYTFLLAVPVMLGASFLKLLKFGFSFSSMEAMILIVGMIVAFIVSVFVIRFFMGYIKKHDFKVFGWYRIVLGIIVIAYFAFR